MGTPQLQQGDVLIDYVDNIPDGAKKVNPVNNKYVLAEGETTGHMHVIPAEDDVEVYEHEGTLYIRSKTDKPISHEEHNKFVIPAIPGKVARRRIVREMDHVSQMVSPVKD